MSANWNKFAVCDTNIDKSLGHNSKLKRFICIITSDQGQIKLGKPVTSPNYAGSYQPSRSSCKTVNCIWINLCAMPVNWKHNVWHCSQHNPFFRRRILSRVTPQFFFCLFRYFSLGFAFCDYGIRWLNGARHPAFLECNELRGTILRRCLRWSDRFFWSSKRLIESIWLRAHEKTSFVAKTKLKSGSFCESLSNCFQIVENVRVSYFRPKSTRKTDFSQRNTWRRNFLPFNFFDILLVFDCEQAAV